MALSESEELAEAAAAVRRLQAKGVKDKTGKGWAEWIEARSQGRSSSSRGVTTKDPSRQLIFTCFLVSIAIVVSVVKYDHNNDNDNKHDHNN